MLKKQSTTTLQSLVDLLNSRTPDPVPPSPCREGPPLTQSFAGILPRFLRMIALITGCDQYVTGSTRLWLTLYKLTQ